MLGFYADNVFPQMSAAEQEQFAAAVKRAVSQVFSPDAFGDLLNEVAKAGPSGPLVLTGTLIAVGYVVFRPLSPVFRVKRMLFNLAPSGRVDLGRTTATWHVARTNGLYALERALFARLGARPPREANLDLWAGAAGTVSLALLFASVTNNMFRLAAARQDPTYVSVLTDRCRSGLITARTIWLVQTARGRRAAPSARDPGGFAVPRADRVVETRSVLETAAFGSLFSFLPVVLPSPMWVRLVRQRRDLERAWLRAQGRTRRLPSGSLWPALGSAALLPLFPPLLVTWQLIRLVRLQLRGVGSARRTLAWLGPLVTAAWPGLWFGFYLYGTQSIPVVAMDLIVLAAAAAYTAAYAAIQHEHNALIQCLGTPLPYDNPHGRDSTGTTG